MPIPIKKLKEAQQPLAGRISGLLVRNPQMAYSLLEIVAELEGYRERRRFRFMMGIMDEEERHSIVKPYLQALQGLLQKGEVTSAVYQGIEYFAIKVPS